MATVGVAAYLEPLNSRNGALRVRPGSHRAASIDAPNGEPAEGRFAGHAIATDPGDMIVFDERLWHASSGGAERRQWRTDFVADPNTPAEERQIRGYFRGHLPARVGRRVRRRPVPELRAPLVRVTQALGRPAP